MTKQHIKLMKAVFQVSGRSKRTRQEITTIAKLLFHSSQRESPTTAFQCTAKTPGLRY